MVGEEDLRTLQELVEVTDMRVFKLKGTNPQADVFWITRELPTSTVSTVAVRLRNFCQKFMPDTLMVQRLEAEDIYRNAGVHRMLWEEEDQLRAELALPGAAINELVKFNSEGLSIEHVLPQNPAFNIEHYGFADVDQYEEHKHRLGNLFLLEASLNSACQNKTVEEKVTLPSLYLTSGIKTVKALAATRSGAIQGYRRENIEERGAQLAQLLLERWPITRENPETKVASAAEQA
ncbi:HNH endonuclease family protein [Burkholderia vietnamiensis]|nr:HNH endonuclease family protein [Burkholderia vietnamiensis]